MVWELSLSVCLELVQEIGWFLEVGILGFKELLLVHLGRFRFQVEILTQIMKVIISLKLFLITKRTILD